MTAAELEDYLRNKMRMSQVYQPAMLRVLLQGGGQASTRDIAQALLSHDQSQVEYYEDRTKQMVGKVLTSNGIVEPIKKGMRTIGYRLAVEDLSTEEAGRLCALCDEKISTYIDKRGAAIWDHRRNTSGYVPGSVRYKVLSRAKMRCELCGAHEHQAALQVDHIIPRNKGGSDDISNFQALCSTCNANKRDTDDTDFRGILDSYKEREEDCIFCNVGQERIIAENELCFAIRDAYPVTHLHTLVIPKRHVADYFDLHQPEHNAANAMMRELKADINARDQSVSGFNVGVNAGASAGQTVFHVHFHLIPRREGDVDEPRGGVRGVIPSRQAY